jgi:hypothetical protein
MGGGQSCETRGARTTAGELRLGLKERVALLLRLGWRGGGKEAVVLLMRLGSKERWWKGAQLIPLFGVKEN